jgi:hypothetical protein
MEQINVINDLIRRSFGEEFINYERKDVTPALPVFMPVIEYDFKSSKLDRIGMVSDFIGPFVKVKTVGRFAHLDGSGLVVPKSYVDNAERYVKLFENEGLGEAGFEIKGRFARYSIRFNPDWKQEELVRGITGKEPVVKR